MHSETIYEMRCITLPSSKFAENSKYVMRNYVGLGKSNDLKKANNLVELFPPKLTRPREQCYRQRTGI